MSLLLNDVFSLLLLSFTVASHPLHLKDKSEMTVISSSDQSGIIPITKPTSFQTSVFSLFRKKKVALKVLDGLLESLSGQICFSNVTKADLARPVGLHQVFFFFKL